MASLLQAAVRQCGQCVFLHPYLGVCVCMCVRAMRDIGAPRQVDYFGCSSVDRVGSDGVDDGLTDWTTRRLQC